MGLLVEFGWLDAVLHDLEADVVIFRPVSSRISRRRAASEVSLVLILPPGMPHLWLHLWVWIISTSPRALKISAPTVGMGGCGGDAAMPIEKIAHLAQVAEEQVGIGAP